MKDEKFKISVSGQNIGIVGLHEIFLQAKQKGSLSEKELEKFLLEEAKKKNFIPARAEGEYTQALRREFKKFLGEKVEEDFSTLQVRVLGPGCVNCQKLEQETLAALTDLNLAADFEHVRDILEIAQYRVLGIPALVINGQVKCVGRVPGREQIKSWLLEGERGK